MFEANQKTLTLSCLVSTKQDIGNQCGVHQDQGTPIRTLWSGSAPLTVSINLNVYSQYVWFFCPNPLIVNNRLSEIYIWETLHTNSGTKGLSLSWVKQKLNSSSRSDKRLPKDETQGLTYGFLFSCTLQCFQKYYVPEVQLSVENN